MKISKFVLIVSIVIQELSICTRAALYNRALRSVSTVSVCGIVAVNFGLHGSRSKQQRLGYGWLC